MGKKAIVFTDGASRGNPGPGGWGAVVIFPVDRSDFSDFKVVEIGGKENFTTNNRMEIEAAINALKILDDQSEAVIFTDSSYLSNGITKWIFGWQNNGWLTKNGKSVENKDLWEKLFEISVGKKLEWKNVSGHAGILGNERCDEIATVFADGGKPELFSGHLSEYPLNNMVSFFQKEIFKDVKSLRPINKNKAYSYVSFVDGRIGIHKTWDECKRTVFGKSGARYKKALSKEAESEIIDSFKNV